MMFCMVEWCLRMPLPLLMETSDSEKSCLHKVFRVRVVDVCGQRESVCVCDLWDGGGGGGGGWECVCERERESVCVWSGGGGDESVCVRGRECGHVCLFLYVCVCFSMSVCVCFSMSVCVCFYMSVCEPMFHCFCVYRCMYVHMFTCMLWAKSTLLLSPLLPCVKLLMAPLSTCAVYAHRHLQFTHAYLIVCSQCIPEC